MNLKEENKFLKGQIILLKDCVKSLKEAIELKKLANELKNKPHYPSVDINNPWGHTDREQ